MSTLHTLGAALGAALLASGCGPSPAEPVVPATTTIAPVATATSTEATCVDGKPGACGAGQACVAGTCRASRSISANGADACVVSSGKVVCWGDNSKNLVAAGPKGPRATPVVVPGIDDATMVRVGPDFGCAVTSAGKVACFGEGGARELPVLTDVTDIAIEDDVLLAVRKNGEVTGVNLGSHGKEMRPVEVPKITDAASISASRNHACVVQAHGDVTCWGDPSSTGSGNDVSNLGWEAREELAKQPVHPKGLKDVVQLSVGESHTCAVLATRKLMCWGSNWSGELGDGTSDERLAPVAVQLIDNAVEVAAGHHHTCVRQASGKVVCWGDGRSGQLGAGVESVKGMVEARDVTDATALALGEELSCAARASGGVSCWGSASRGRLGNGVVSDNPVPQPVKGVAGATLLALGDGMSCALDGQKQLACWGSPGYLPDDQRDKRSFTPTPLAGLGEVVSAWGKGSGFCTINKANEITCGYASALRKGPNTKRMDLKGVKLVQSSGSSGFGVLASGQVFLWSNPDELQKITLNGLSDAVSVATTGNVICAARRSGKVGCVAYSYRTFDKKEPIKPTGVVEVPGVKDAVQVASDGGDVCILHKTGEVGCFSAYRVPSPVDPKAKAKEKDKKDKEKPRPIEVTPVKGLSDVTFVAAGGGSYCAVKKDATLSCWGSNRHGQLGIGDYSNAWDAVPVPGLANVATVAIGGGQTCAANKNGEVLCWGDNAVDQAGQPAPSFARSPVPVTLP
jgi:alpha-tubulin suppressor-like RCC1 family protein